ncbi:TetR/AcrR family transcriptional regulator [uncultured Clostridium sp.]|uniref:TetR/AcrR family transcriptional regulator n=1 Tax=uncultured Clostridium sp. TaxID=59620 RepID=UPI0026266F24|nr:TetR/AcrR family transcriptional regulator [uncultured Clostridium sp.]
MNKSKEKIVQQSKRWLCEALMNLMSEGKSYTTITVKEISEKALLSRRTFYRHFKNKNELLKEYTLLLFNDYFEIVLKNNPTSFKDVITIYFSFWNKNIEILKCLKENGLFFTFVEQHNNLIENITVNILKFKSNWHNYDDYIDAQYMTLYSIGGLWIILSKWIDDPYRKPPTEMSDILIKAFKNFLN